MNLKFICNNHGLSDFKTEHGFSLFIQTDHGTILFDTGQGSSLIENAHKLNIDLSTIDTLILSHGHYDHTGGLCHFLELNTRATIYCHRSVTIPRYSIHKDNSVHTVSTTWINRFKLLNLPEYRVKWVSGIERINDIVISGPIPRCNNFEDTGGAFFLDTEGTKPDSIPDDMAIAIDTSNGWIIITGCCHSGIINTLNHFQSIPHLEKIHAVIGGFHLVHASKERLENTCNSLKEYKIPYLVPCHCSGDIGVHYFKENLKDSQIIEGMAGMELSYQ